MVAPPTEHDGYDISASTAGSLVVIACGLTGTALLVLSGHIVLGSLVFVATVFIVALVHNFATKYADSIGAARFKTAP
jgi:uncharacterized membrane protein